MTMDARKPMRPGTRRAFLNGFVAGYRSTCDWHEACRRGWEFRGGWLDGRQFRGCLTPYGARVWLRDTGWFGYRHLDRRIA